MAPFFPMENVEGKSLSSYHSGRAQTHKSSTLFVVKTSISIRETDRQKKKKKKKRKKKVFFCVACGA